MAPEAVSVCEAPIQIEDVAGVTLTMGPTITLTVMLARGLTQLPTVCDTYHVVLPTVAVEGVGAMLLPMPPVGVVYQRRFVPVAVSGLAAAPWQYVMGDVTTGAAGGGSTATCTLADESQPASVAVTVYVPPIAAVAGPRVVFC